MKLSLRVEIGMHLALGTNQPRGDLGTQTPAKMQDAQRAFLVRAMPLRAQWVSELACGSQAFIATLLFDPSMSALPIIPKQNSVSVGLFTH